MECPDPPAERHHLIRLPAGGNENRTLGPPSRAAQWHLAMSETAGGFRRWPGIEAGQAASSALPSATLVHPARIKQAASSVDISTMRSSPIVMRRPDSVWTAPIPGGASRRT